MEITFFQALWFVLIFVLIAGYFVLDGFDLGVGVLYPFIAKNEQEKALVRQSIAPVWDGNEVWLLTVGGALFAAFPAAYATTFSGFYLAIMLVLFGLIMRAVSLEFRAHDLRWKKLWDGFFFVGSLLPALLLGLAVCKMFEGIPMDANGNYIGVALFGLISPFSLLCGLFGLSMFVAQGISWLALKLPKSSEVQLRAVKLRLPLVAVALFMYALVAMYGHFLLHATMVPYLNGLRWICAISIFVGIVLSVLFGVRKNNDLGAFLAQSFSAIALTGLLGSSMFPNLVVATAESIGPNLTVVNAASSELSLMWMAVIAAIGLPLVIVYHVIAYRSFRGRVSAEDIQRAEVCSPDDCAPEVCSREGIGVK